ncbi:hypothetical protein [Salininema proteolyticum]|uniref:Insertion element protein n=1 Tax=Salininema proteolyticum TaxID=1607685 RepID=A0ABV8TZH8_9ACTN
MSARMVPYLCPYCGDEDLVPHEDETGEVKGAWHCHSCTRIFTVRYHGMEAPATTPVPDLGGGSPKAP